MTTKHKAAAKGGRKTSRKVVKKPAKQPLFKTKSGHKLTVQQKLFCELFATDREFFCNGVRSYIEAYSVDTTKPGWYSTAKSGAHENLTKPYLLDYIKELLELGGLNDEVVDKQLLKLIIQDADFSAKIKAIQEYNKLQGRITEKKEINGGIQLESILPKPERKERNEKHDD